MSRTERLSLEITCQLSEAYFGDWNDLSPEIVAFWDSTDDQPHCEGSGYIGELCNGCPFCDLFDVSED